MALPRVNLIVCIDSLCGIGKSALNSLPWNNSEDMTFFKKTTTGNKVNAPVNSQNVCIFGRNTYYSLPIAKNDDVGDIPNHMKTRKLPNRNLAVISTKMKQSECQGVSVFPSVKDCLLRFGAIQTKSPIGTYNFDIFVCGGSVLYDEIIYRWGYLIDNIYINKLKMSYNCDVHFDFDFVQKNFDLVGQPSDHVSFTKFIYTSRKISLGRDLVYHQEEAYLNLLRRILTDGELQMEDRTKVGTRFLFGNNTMTFDISESIPLFTTRQLEYGNAIKELLFFLSGNTNSQTLEASSVNWWKQNTSLEQMAKLRLPYVAGDMGPAYGFNLRHYGAEYKGCLENYEGKGFDQIQNLITEIRLNRFSRRHVITMYNPSEMHNCPLPPCHGTVIHFNVNSDNQMDCQVYQRSGDMMLGVPYNVFQYAILLRMVCHLTGSKARFLHYNIGNAHIYSDHTSDASRLLDRSPLPLASLSFSDPDRIRTIEDFTTENIIIEGYESHNRMKMKMSV